MNALHQLAEHRCQCGKLLFKALEVSSIIEIKCRRCGKIMRFGNRPQAYFDAVRTASSK